MHELGQLPLLGQDGPLILAALVLVLWSLDADVHAPSRLLALLAFLFLVARVVDAEDAAHDLSAAQVVHGQVARPLVLVLEEAEPFALARLLVADQVDVHRFAVLREDGYDVAFRNVEGEAANVDVCLMDWLATLVKPG